jgi:transposase
MENTLARKLKQVPEGYLIIGVDPHKKKHATVAITQDFNVQAKFKFDNAREGLEMMLRQARLEMMKSACRGVMFAIETGGHYWRNVAYFLDEKGIPFRFINQYTLKRRREGKDLNRRKNDYRDAEVAAQLLCTGEFVESVIPQGVYAELRTAHNGYRRLIKERTRITNLIKGLLDGLFPEFVQVFKDPCGLTALSVLSTCPVPGVIAGMTEGEFVATIEARHQGRLMRKKLRALHHTAGVSIGIAAGAKSLSMEISFLVEKLNLIERHIGIIERTLIRLVDATDEGKYLLSIRGLNYIAVAGLLAELGCFKAYRSAKQLLAEAGYPNGFKVKITTPNLYVDRVSIVKQYFADIGVGLEIEVFDVGTFANLMLGHTYKDMCASFGWGTTNPYSAFRYAYRTSLYGYSGVDDPYFDQTYLDIIKTIDVHERSQKLRDLRIKALGQVYWIPLPTSNLYVFWQPWIKGYSGEYAVGRTYNYNGIWNYAWIDEAEKAKLTGRE